MKKAEVKVENVKLVRRPINFGDNLVVITPELYKELINSPRNRAINPLHVRKMKESVLRNGCFRDVVVVYDATKKKYIIVDGQHLTVALQELNRAITCKIADCETEEEITQLMIDINNTSKSWSLENYINSWAESGLKAYKHLRTEIALSDIPMTTVIQALSQKPRGTATKLVKEGKFEIANKQRGEELIQYVSDCATILPNTRPVCEALIKLMLTVEQYDHKRMLRACKSAVKQYIFSTKESEMYKQLVEIYNA